MYVYLYACKQRPFLTQLHTATHCNKPQHTALNHTTRNSRLSALSPTTTHCNTLHHTATRRNTLQHTAAHHNTLHHTTPHYKQLTTIRPFRHDNTPQIQQLHSHTLRHLIAQVRCLPPPLPQPQQPHHQRLCIHLRSRSSSGGS